MKWTYNSLNTLLNLYIKLQLQNHSGSFLVNKTINIIFPLHNKRDVDNAEHGGLSFIDCIAKLLQVYYSIDLGND